MNTDRIREILAANGFVWTEQNRPTMWVFYAREFPWGERVVTWASNIKPFHIDPPKTVEVAFQRKREDGTWGTLKPNDNRYIAYDGMHHWDSAEKLYAAIEDGAYRSCHHPNDLFAKTRPPAVQLDGGYASYADYAAMRLAQQSAMLASLRLL